MAQSQYATTNDLQSLSITPAAAGRFGSTAMNAALQAASSIADSYLAAQFELPLQTNPKGWDMSLTLNICNIAAWLLYNQFGFSPMAPGDELVVKRYEAALDWLGQIRDKKIFPQFTDSSSDQVVGEDEGGPWVNSDPPVGFTQQGTTNTVCNSTWPWFWGW